MISAARASLGSSRWPITSTKNKYSHGRARSGRDSIFEMLIRVAGKQVQRLVERADPVATAKSRVVLSFPDFSIGRVPITRKRVVLAATSCTLAAMVLRPYASPAAFDAIAAIDPSAAARCAASALDATASVSILGKFALR